MNTILVDTNIVIDLLAKREPFYVEAASLFSLADKKQIKLFVSALTIANTNYILSKVIKSAEAKSILRKFILLAEVLPLNDTIINLALNNQEFVDFEDGLQYFTALENHLDLIVTRNQKDFKMSVLPVMTSEQFLKRYHQNAKI